MCDLMDMTQSHQLERWGTQLTEHTVCRSLHNRPSSHAPQATREGDHLIQGFWEVLQAEDNSACQRRAQTNRVQLMMIFFSLTPYSIWPGLHALWNALVARKRC
jgi:hypothetical protein